MIPEQITNPKGCGREYGEDEEMICCDYENAPIQHQLCPQCKNIQKAQIQTLLDEKKNELEFLNKVKKDMKGRKNFEMCFDEYLYDKIQELKEDIKVLEEMLK